MQVYTCTESGFQAIWCVYPSNPFFYLIEPAFMAWLDDQFSNVSFLYGVAPVFIVNQGEYNNSEN